MRTPRGLLFITVAALLLHGCGPHDARYDPTHYRVRGVLAPPDVVLPHGARSGEEVDGLYTMDADAYGICCLIGMRAHLLVQKYAVASHLRVAVSIPNAAAFARDPQRITVAFPSAHRVVSVGPLPSGFHMITLDAPRALQSFVGKVPVIIECATAYQPVAHARRYGLVLLSAYFD